MKKACLIIFSALLTMSSAHAATYYKWVDDNGLTHYSATPPEGRPSVQIERGSSRSPSGITPSIPSANEPNEAAARTEDKLEAEGFEQNLAAAEETRKKNCDTARENKVQLTLKNRIKLLQDDGTYRVLSDEEKQQKVRQADEAIDTYCN
ncbi:DUF4124 domain-containing protein [Aestuariirhabdus sp. LZHN29]|uniref:DUF4124 domain-containing protein n=1 Tax=Aestuariirhabdus sp. LZHN29 TaxID=3417462 RepID=UPI003CFB973A